MALTTSGCEWPVEFTAMPAAQSRKMLPSTSSTVDPVPRAMTSGYPRVYDGETTVVSRSMIFLALGPGSGVLIDGTSTLFPLPARARGVVLEQHPACRQILPDAI